MNNIEVKALQDDIIKYFGNRELAENIHLMRDDKIHRIKKELNAIKLKEQKSNQEKYRKRQLERQLKERLEFHSSSRSISSKPAIEPDKPVVLK